MKTVKDKYLVVGAVSGKHLELRAGKTHEKLRGLNRKRRFKDKRNGRNGAKRRKGFPTIKSGSAIRFFRPGI